MSFFHESFSKVFYGRVWRAERERNNRKPLSLSSSLSLNCRVAGHQPLPPPPSRQCIRPYDSDATSSTSQHNRQSVQRVRWAGDRAGSSSCLKEGLGFANAAAQRRTPSSRRLWDHWRVGGGRARFSCNAAADNETGCCLLLSPDSRESAWVDLWATQRCGRGGRGAWPDLEHTENGHLRAPAAVKYELFVSLPPPHPSTCTQAYIHTRMRAKTSDFLKVLNRARPDADKKEMKTIS